MRVGGAEVGRVAQRLAAMPVLPRPPASSPPPPPSHACPVTKHACCCQYEDMSRPFRYPEAGWLGQAAQEKAGVGRRVRQEVRVACKPSSCSVSLPAQSCHAGVLFLQKREARLGAMPDAFPFCPRPFLRAGCLPLCVAVAGWQERLQWR